MKPSDPLALRVPRNLTALLQHLQLLVGREAHRWWCGGLIARDKLPAFAEKMAARYPILRNTRQRSYGRQRGRASLHFVAFPVGEQVAWWLLSSTGSGGLADPASPDHHVARDALTRDGHLAFMDYVLLYAHKREPRHITDKKTGRVKTLHTDVSTWTWQLNQEVLTELRRGIEACCERLEYGDEGGPGRRPWGLRGLLAAQRARPLFSGVRTQVLELHREAIAAWGSRRPLWLQRHPELATRYGAAAGSLRSAAEVAKVALPKMTRISVYDDPPRTLRDLIRAEAEDTATG